MRGKRGRIALPRIERGREQAGSAAKIRAPQSVPGGVSPALAAKEQPGAHWARNARSIKKLAISHL